MLTYSIREWLDRQPAGDRTAWYVLAVGIAAVAILIFRLSVGPYSHWPVIAAVAIIGIRSRRPSPIIRDDSADGPLPSWVDCTGGRAELSAESLLNVATSEEMPEAEWQFRAELAAEKVLHLQSALSAISEMLDGATAARRIAESAASHSAESLRAAVRTLAKADKTASEWRDKYRTLRNRVYKSRARKIERLEGSVRAAERRHSIAKLIRSYGGICREDSTILASFKDWKDAIANGIPKNCFVKSRDDNHKWARYSLETMAEQWAADGIIQVPADRHAPDYLLELLATGATAHTGHEDELYSARAELASVTAEHSHDDISFNPSEFE